VANDRDLTEMFKSALSRVVDRGWAFEVDHFRQLKFDQVDGSFFFQEYAHCVYASGFKWAYVNMYWPELTQAYRDWDYMEVCKYAPEVRVRALEIINYPKKVDAILSCASRLKSRGWEDFKHWLETMDLLVTPGKLGYIGPATRYHLARNIGADVAKPDRYMLDLANEYGYPRTDAGVQALAKRISQLSGERVGVVDVVLWRDVEGSRY